MSKDAKPVFRDVFARYWALYEAQYGQRIPGEHRAAARAIFHCRTPVMGGSLYRCNDCGSMHYACHGCNHRNCPQCGYQDGLDWAARQKEKLLPVPYSMVTFTVPETLRRLFRSNQKICYDLLLKCSAEALKSLCLEPLHLGAEVGFISVLHTWTRQMEYHPHVHCIVPMGGLTKDGNWRRCKDPGYFLPVKALSARMRKAMRETMRVEHPDLYRKIPNTVWREAWVTHIAAMNKGDHAIDYLSRYVSQSALSKNRILHDDGENVMIGYTESGTGAKKTMRLNGLEFIRRFLQHVLPGGFKRIRNYGWLSAAAHRKFDRIRKLLNCQPVENGAEQNDSSGEESQNWSCRRCGGDLQPFRIWDRGRAPPELMEVSLSLHEKKPSKDKSRAPEKEERVSV